MQGMQPPPHTTRLTASALFIYAGAGHTLTPVLPTGVHMNAISAQSCASTGAYLMRCRHTINSETLT